MVGETQPAGDKTVYVQVQKDKCKAGGKTTKYVGETSRYLYERLSEHTRDYQSKETPSHMRDH